MSQPDTTIEGIIKQFLVEVMEVVGDEFAPKQEGGSLERQRLLGLLVHTVPLQIETAQALEFYINNKVKEARIDENQRWANGYAQVLLDYPDIDEPELFMKAKGDFEDRIKELEK